MHNIKIYCPTIRDEFFNELAGSISDFIEVIKVDGRNAACLSSLFNDSIEKSEADWVILSNDKARPAVDDIVHMFDLFNNNFGFVALFRYGFFGLHKKVVAKVGWFDERFITGGYEDNDFLFRLRINDIGVYISEEINYITTIPTTWNHLKSMEFFKKKYSFNFLEKNVFIKKREPSTGRILTFKDEKLLTWKDSIIKCSIPCEVYGITNQVALLNTYSYIKKLDDSDSDI
jgi:hypothetical protein